PSPRVSTTGPTSTPANEPILPTSKKQSEEIVDEPDESQVLGVLDSGQELETNSHSGYLIPSFFDSYAVATGSSEEKLALVVAAPGYVPRPWLLTGGLGILAGGI